MMVETGLEQRESAGWRNFREKSEEHCGWTAEMLIGSGIRSGLMHPELLLSQRSSFLCSDSVVPNQPSATKDGDQGQNEGQCLLRLRKGQVLRKLSIRFLR